MSSMLSSQGVVIATAMVVSSTGLFLAFSRHYSGFTNHPPEQRLRSCLCIDERKKRKKKNKRVQFADSVEETKGNSHEYRKKRSRRAERAPTKRLIPARSSPSMPDTVCRQQIPANRLALYSGILRDRAHRMECSC